MASPSFNSINSILKPILATNENFVFYLATPFQIDFNDQSAGPDGDSQKDLSIYSSHSGNDFQTFK